MKKILRFVLRSRYALTLIICLGLNHDVWSQISLTATGGTPAGSFTTISDAFVAINAGTHTGSIIISVDGNTTEPAVPVALLASGQSAASYTDILIKPTVTAVISGATSAGSAVINLDGADNVMIDGSIAVGGTTRDLTIQNTAVITQANIAAIRLIGRTTGGLGAANNTIKNCIIIGNTPGNDGSSGSTVTTSYGIYAGSTSATTMSSSAGSADYDNLLIENNEVKKAYIGIYVFGAVSPNQADNLIIRSNNVSSAVNADRVGFKGMITQHINGGLITQNEIQNIKSSNSASIAAIDVSGSATANVEISRNMIFEVHTLATGGWGAYGINVANGTNTLITNNVIHGVLGTNYNSVSTTFQAFGIRLAGGTGHKVYYNSVNMFGAFTIGSSTTYTISAAMVVTSTAITGLDIRNNIFNNQNTSLAATTAEFVGVWFPSGYNFLNAVLDNNSYNVTDVPKYHVGKTGTTIGSGNHTTLAAWQLISQVNNPTNDVNSKPASGNGNAPFTSDTDLSIPALTATPIESGGVAIVSLGLPNIDINAINRPAGTGTAPDIGAYEFEGDASGDFTAPAISSVTATPATGQCTVTAHTIDAVITDAVGVTSATLSYSYSGVAQTPITMTLTSGTSTNGTWSATIPAASGPGVLVTYSVQASDVVPNLSASVSGTSYTDEYLTVTTSPVTQTITLGSSVTLSASTNDPAHNGVLITEIIQYKGGTGDGTYPGYIPTADNDFIELTNISTIPMDISGYQVQLLGGVTGTYTVPAGSVLAPGGTMVLSFASTTNSPSDNYYGMGLATTSSAVAMGYILKSTSGTILDAVATNGYTFLSGSGVTTGDWSGNIASSSGLAGARRTAASDNDLASDWTLSSGANLTNVGAYNTGISTIAITTFFTWSPNGQTTDVITETPGSTGTFIYTASYNDGTCTAMSSSTVNVITPVIPVADFSVTPLVGSAPTVVNFTDLSTNIPNTWSWTLSPATGFTYTGGTSASSQNPQITFTSPGIYTVTLVAGNMAGSDDSVKVDYIVVNTCTSAANNTADTDIGNFTFGALSNGTATPTTSNPSAVNTYTDYTALTPVTYTQGLTYPMSMTQITGGTTFYGAYVNVFIDYNQDGIFDDVTEKVMATGETTLATPTLSGNVTIPLTAMTGITKMRVVLDENGTSASSACGNYSYGETEDYMIEILPCVISAPAILASATTVCEGTIVTMDATTTGAVSYDWKKDGLSTGVTSAVLTLTGAVPADAGDYSCVVTGCDVVTSDTVTLTVNPASSFSQTIIVCDGGFVVVGSNTYNTSGVYTDILTAVNGCDSTVTTDLTVLLPSGSTQTVILCDGQSVVVGSNTYTSTGVYTDVFTSVDGCDSTVTTDLTVLGPIATTQNVTLCDGQSLTVGSNTYSASGTYTDVFTSMEGCDSTVTTNLVIDLPVTTSQNITLCTGETVTVGSNTYSAAGTYTDVLVSVNGCDSTVTTNVTMNATDLGVTISGITLTANATGMIYQWLDCGNSFAAITGATSQSYTATANGDYSVEIQNGACIDSTLCYTISQVGLEENDSKNAVVIYPNPTRENVTLMFNTATAFVEVYDAQGKLLHAAIIDNGGEVILSDYERGVYYLKVKSENETSTHRIVKN